MMGRSDHAGSVRVALLADPATAGSAIRSGSVPVAGGFVPTSDFLDAFLRFGTTPADVVLPPQLASNMQATLRRLRAECGAASAERFAIVSIAEFERRLAAGGYACLHDAARLRPGFGAFLRERLAPAPFAYTCRSQDASSPSFWKASLLPALWPAGRSYDAILLSSVAEEAVLRCLLDALAEGASPLFNERPGFPGRFIHLPDGVDAHRFRPRDRREMREQLGLPQDALLVLWLGPFGHRSGADLVSLLLAFAQAVRLAGTRDTRLLLYGDDPQAAASAIRELARDMGVLDRVELGPAVPPYAAPLLYTAVDVFMSPNDSLDTECGRILEAMSSGLPIVASSWGPQRELVEHGLTGFLAPTHRAPSAPGAPAISLGAWQPEVRLRLRQSVAIDIGAMARSVATLLVNAELRHEMGERARARAASLFAWPRVIARYEDIWRELAETARRDPQRPSGRWCYPWVELVSAFSAHPSGWVAMETHVLLGERGIAALQGKVRIAPDPPAAPLLDLGLLDRLLRSAAKRAAWKPAPVGRVFEGVVGRDGLERAEGLRHLMWLLKYDLLEVSGE